jgi:soluble lytic murein transglycosylase-like protein
MFNSNLKLAVAGYNAGEGAVMKFNNTVPPYPETQNYVQQVLKLYGKS